MRIWHEQRANSEKMHKIAHKKRACQNCTKSRRTREKSSKKYNKKRGMKPEGSRRNATKCNAKKSIEPRAKLEESAILQHEHGRGMDAPGIYVHDTRAADRDGLLPGRGIYRHDNARLSCCQSEFIYTGICAGEIRHFRHPKKNLRTRERAGSIRRFRSP